MTLQSLIDQAIFLSGAEGVNKDVVAETLVPPVIYWCTLQAGLDPSRRQMTLVSSTVALTNGVGTLPATVLVECVKYAALADPLVTTTAKKMRFIENWNEFIRPLDSTLGYFTVAQSSYANTLYVTLPGSAYTPGSGYTGNVTLTTPTTPTLPATASTAITANNELQYEFLKSLAAAIVDPMAWMSSVNNQKAA